MPIEEDARAQRALLRAVALSLLIHGLALLVPRSDPSSSRAAPVRLEATLGRAQPAPAPETPPLMAEAPNPKEVVAQRRSKAAKPPSHARVMTANGGKGPALPSQPKWTKAERDDMNNFLDDLATQAKTAPKPPPKPTLAQRSLAMAREQGRELEQQAAEKGATLERIPNSPPPDPFSLDMYVDGLIRRLNRSSAFVRNDPRAKGVKVAAVQFRVNPDGTLKSFVVLNAADQQEEIAFIEAVVKRSAPFSPFPADVTRAAKSLAMTICIMPTSGGGFGFTRNADGRGC